MSRSSFDIAAPRRALADRQSQQVAASRLPRLRFPFSALSFCAGAVAVLFVAYIGLVAVAMGYAASAVAFSQSVKDGEAEVAKLESAYLADVARIAEVDYAAEGYVKPLSTTFVRARSAALR